MCTIHTYSAKYFRANERAIHAQILQDSVMNSDGISFLFLDGHNDKTNTIFRTMDVDNALTVMTMLMTEATKHARVFIHLRAATTQDIGVAFTHAFDDMQGVIYMHNGVFSNPRAYSVDSFQMVNWTGTEGGGLLDQLQSRRETFANVLRIDTVKYTWTVTRMDNSILHTDGQGNYSTRKFGDINQEVPRRTFQNYTLSSLPKQRWTSHYSQYLADDEDLTGYYEGSGIGVYKPGSITVLGPGKGDDKSLPPAVDRMIGISKVITEDMLLDEDEYELWLKMNAAEYRRRKMGA